MDLSGATQRSGPVQVLFSLGRKIPHCQWGVAGCPALKTASSQALDGPNSSVMNWVDFRPVPLVPVSSAMVVSCAVMVPDFGNCQGRRSIAVVAARRCHLSRALKRGIVLHRSQAKVTTKCIGCHVWLRKLAARVVSQDMEWRKRHSSTLKINNS